MDNATIPQSAYDFLFHFNRNYVVYLSPFSRYSRLFVKSRRFLPTTSAFGALVGGAVEFRGDLWLQKTRVPGLQCGVVFVIPCLAVLVELRFVTDRQTQTDRHRHRPMASTTDAQHRAVKTVMRMLRNLNAVMLTYLLRIVESVNYFRSCVSMLNCCFLLVQLTGIDVFRSILQGRT